MCYYKYCVIIISVVRALHACFLFLGSEEKSCLCLSPGAPWSVQAELDLLDLLEQLGKLVVVPLEDLVCHETEPRLDDPLVRVVSLGDLLGLAAFCPALAELLAHLGEGSLVRS